MNYALVENGVVLNIIVWDGVFDYPLGEGETLVSIPAGIVIDTGYIYAGSGFLPPATSAP